MAHSNMVGLWMYFNIFHFKRVPFFTFINKYGGGKSYLIRRFFRLYPTFWICVIISALILSNCGDTLISLKTFLLNLTMIPGCFHVNYVDGAYWTMQMELFFTLIMVFILLLKKFSIRIMAIVGWAIVSLIFNLLSPNIDNIVLRSIRIITMPEFAPAFIGGVSIYQIIFNKGRRVTFSIPLIISVISSYFANSISPLFILFVVTLVILFAIKQLEIQLSKYPRTMSFFAYFAAISYPLYLVHQYVGYVIIDNVRIRGFENEIIIVIPIVASIIIATIIHYCFENKLNRIEREKLNFFKF